MKSLVLAVGLLAASQAGAESVHLAFGAANEVCLEAEVFTQAKKMALKAAEENCEYLGKASVRMIRLKNLGSRRGSCWAGIPSGVALSLEYTCEP